MDAKLEDLAAAIESVAGPRALTIEFECASEDLREVLGLVGELAASPAFPQDRLDVTKAQVLESLAHRNDNAASVARRELRKLVLGPDSPWARTPTPEGVRSITRDDLTAFWAAWERPDSAVLAVVGDFDPQQLEEAVRSAFGKWGPAPGQPPVPREPPADGGPAAGAGWQAAGGRGADAPVWLVDRPGAAQASVAAGEPGASLLDPDALALSALNGTLNGFGGSLFDTLRTQEGLCYSVSGGWELPFDRPGLFVAGGETSRPAPFLSELRRVLGEAAARPVPGERLERAKQEKLNSFVFNFATPASQLQRAAAYEVLGVPQDFLTTYRAGIERVTADDVLAAARARLHPTQQPAVVVADAATAGPALRASGFTVIPWDPDAPVDAPAAAAGGGRGGAIAAGRAAAVEASVQQQQQ